MDCFSDKMVEGKNKVMNVEWVRARNNKLEQDSKKDCCAETMEEGKDIKCLAEQRAVIIIVEEGTAA